MKRKEEARNDTERKRLEEQGVERVDQLLHTHGRTEESKQKARKKAGKGERRDRYVYKNICHVEKSLEKGHSVQQCKYPRKTDQSPRAN